MLNDKIQTEIEGHFTFWFQTNFSVLSLVIPVGLLLSSNSFSKFQTPRLLSVLQIEYTLPYTWSFWILSSGKAFPLSSSPLDHLSKLWSSRSNSNVESSIPIHMVQHPGQNLLPFPLCFYSPLFITLSYFKILWLPSCSLWLLFVYSTFTHSFQKALLSATIFQVLVCSCKNKKSSPLSSHGAWTLIVSEFWVPWVSVSLSPAPNTGSFLHRVSTKCRTLHVPLFPQIIVACLIECRNCLTIWKNLAFPTDNCCMCDRV